MSQPGAVYFTDISGAALVYANNHLVVDPTVTDANKEKSFTVAINPAGGSQVTANVLKQYAGNYTLRIGGAKLEDQNEPATPEDPSDDTLVYDAQSRAKISKTEGAAKTSSANYVDLTVTISAETGYITIDDGEPSLAPTKTMYAAADGGTKDNPETGNVDETQIDNSPFTLSLAAWLS